MLHSATTFHRSNIALSLCTHLLHLVSALRRCNRPLHSVFERRLPLDVVLTCCTHSVTTYIACKHPLYMQWTQMLRDWEEVRHCWFSTMLQNHLQSLSSLSTPTALEMVSFYCRVFWTKTLLGPHSTQQGALPSPFHPPPCFAPPHTQTPTGPG